MTIAITHPGKMGDTLYALPLARLVSSLTGEQIDFYTSEYCKPLQNLIEYQSYVNECIIPADYTIERMDIGVQPWLMPVREGYSKVIHAGFHGVPDRPIHEFIAHQAGYTQFLDLRYDYPELTTSLQYEDYICIAPRGETSFKHLFDGVAKLSNVNAVIIGGKGDYTGYGIDYTGLDMLDTLSILSRAKGFVGLMSSQLVLANGFPIPRIAPHDGIHWDMRHVVYSHLNHYPINPSVADVLALLDK